MRSGVLTGLRPEDLDLDATLTSGQVFRWRRGDDGVWRGALGRRRVALRAGDDGRAVAWSADGADPEDAVRRFLRLDDCDLPAAAARWGDEPAFAAAWARQSGVRILRQPRTECFFSFLCATAAPIRRIAAMCAALADEAGDDLGDGWRAFPDPERLARIPERRLRALGLGFRAPRVAAAARRLAAEPDLLDSLPGGDRDAVQEALRPLPGVGPKIADCVALFAFDCDDAVPVDTHIWRLTRTRYAPELAGKTLTPANYDRARQAWRERFGAHAGWAQQILFHQAAHKE